MSTNATLSGSGSWVFQSVELLPAAALTVTFRILASGFADPASTSCSVQIGGFGGPSAAQVGDFLLAAVVTASSGGQTITPPAGWTAIRTDTGVGTNGCIQECFWKVAVAGDLVGTKVFTLGNSSKATVDVGVYYNVNATPIGATSAAVSSADGTAAVAPTIAATVGDLVVDLLGAREATASVMSVASSTGSTDRGGQSSSGGGGGFRSELFDYVMAATTGWTVGILPIG